MLHDRMDDQKENPDQEVEGHRKEAAVGVNVFIGVSLAEKGCHEPAAGGTVTMFAQVNSLPGSQV